MFMVPFVIFEYRTNRVGSAAPNFLEHFLAESLVLTIEMQKNVTISNGRRFFWSSL